MSKDTSIDFEMYTLFEVILFECVGLSEIRVCIVSAFLIGFLIY